MAISQLVSLSTFRRITRRSAFALCMSVLLGGLAGAQDYEHNESIDGAVIYDHDSSTKLGDDIFGNVIANFGGPANGRLRCSHGGPVCIMKDGRLLAGAYVTADENHLYYCISQDGGHTWGKQQKAYLNKKIRDPELAYLDGKYYLQGRSGQRGDGSHRFVIYQSNDGIRWKNGVFVSGDKGAPDGYSHNCIINKYDKDKPNELMILYSIVYSPPRTSEYVFFVRPERQQLK